MCVKHRWMCAKEIYNMFQEINNYVSPSYIVYIDIPKVIYLFT